MCITRTNKIWKLVEKRRTYSSRKWVMTKMKNKKQQVFSESSYMDIVDRITTPHGPAARDRTHPGGNFEDTYTQVSASTPVISHRSLTHRDKKTSTTGHRSHVNRSPVSCQYSDKFVNHRSPVIQSSVIKLRKTDSMQVKIHQSTGYQSTSHR